MEVLSFGDVSGAAAAAMADFALALMQPLLPLQPAACFETLALIWV